MKSNPGWIHLHKGIFILAVVLCMFFGVFFLVPVIHVTTVGCASDWESPGYYFYKTGYHVLVQPNNGCY